MEKRKHIDDSDVERILQQGEAQLRAAPSKQGALDAATLRTVVLTVAFIVAIAVVTLPQLRFGGFKEATIKLDATPLGPVFGQGCKRHHRSVNTPWPLKGPRHVRDAWIHKSDFGSQSDTQYAHMAMIESLGNGSMVAAFQASTRLEGSNDQHIRLSFAHDLSGLSWGPSQPMPVPRTAAQWSPVLHRDTKSRLWIFYTEGRDCKHDSSKDALWYPGGDIKVTMLGEGGAKWKAPRTIYAQTEDDGIPKVLANKLIVLSDGQWVLPLWSERHSAGTCQFGSEAVASAGVLVSRDQGWSWERRGRISSSQTWLIENSVVELKNGHLLMFFRTLKGFIYQAVSADQGYTWSTAEASSLANPDAKIHLARLADGMLAVAYNNHQKLKRPYRRCRTNLDVSVSINEGRTWTRLARLEDTEEGGLRNHYPTMLQVGCTLYVAYSRFYHEEFAYRATNTTGHLGVRIVALDL
eukprot:CAMPEP_0198214686 /NCGR_PEP_ID=MMETSP1445-20131203/43204_1 /TAXON_ID=36898 /ORGANISM="Pyramimonas sp., Strain CCMP2087" /LENGTH=465 /DNA_ID=CAMNT_0043889973 /DNA_START=206 /DNA_END=1600 /DNA_ORIENTATION=+